MRKPARSTFTRKGGSYDYQADVLFDDLIPQVMQRQPGLTGGKIAILYPAAWIGDAVANAAQRHGFSFMRTDGNALYPRFSRVMRWLEQCAMWSCGGWEQKEPRFSRIAAEAYRIFSETVHTDEERMVLQRELLAFLLARRDSGINLHGWLLAIRNELLQSRFLGGCRWRSACGLAHPAASLSSIGA